MASPLVNFRCPPDVLTAIRQLGRDIYPADNDSGCDQSKTVIEIIRAGIEALSGGSIVLPVPEVRQQPTGVKQPTSNTLSDSDLDERITAIVERKTAALREEILGEFAA